MRQIQVQVSRKAAERVVEIARHHGAVAVSRVDGRSADGGTAALVFLSIPNAQLGSFVEAASEVGAVEFAFLPTDSLILGNAPGEIPAVVRTVQARSPIELLIGSEQSLGGWVGMLIYSILSGIVAAYAIIFDIPFVLVAAMLISPVGAPAMVAVAGSALGDRSLIRSGTLRFVVALAVLALVAVVIGLAYGMRVSTATMELVTTFSIWTGVIAMAGGAAGAAAQIRSERDSLVTGTATGFLIAVALSPPAAVMGLAASFGRWDYVGQMAFVLTVTYLGILLGGTLTLGLHGVHPHAAATDRGSYRDRRAWVGIVAVLFFAALGWQATRGPSFRKADLAYEALEVTRGAVQEVDRVQLIEAEARFTRRDLPDVEGEALYVRVVVEPLGVPAVVVREDVRAIVGRRLSEEMPGVVPYVEVSVVAAAP